MKSVVFGIITMGEQEVFLIGFFFHKTYLKNHVMDNFLPYKLIGNAAYPMWPWLCSPFKGKKYGLQKYKEY